ncbi:MAG: tRNA uridine-5-carboxymethylaminomethyl(34) synthesis GTPase MnmE [Oscillospiraceae bacterium]|nr:tRNA uridine-5-carboxymethylaminomethyl(34) synthesis GTPase MnmE [Oscillospiraceae bacterium]
METIVVISTAPGVGGIGIVRMSGEDSFKILNRIFKAKNEETIENIKGYSIKYGEIVESKTNRVVDEVLVSYFKAPKSYTAENMCEINSHGSIVVVREIMELCLAEGAVLAEPGEFTKRAFLNGRIDLSQAEATADIISARTKIESRAAVSQLEGYLSRNIMRIKGNVLDLLVDMEANIDYPEYDIEEVTEDRVRKALFEIRNELDVLLRSFEDGKIIKEGIRVAIIGSPNVGKSSLLNSMLQEERVIVTEIAGTTRDTIEEVITIEGIPFYIIDTAGIRNVDDKVEKIGIKKSKKVAEQSDVILTMFDSSKELSKEDKEILEFVKDKNAIIVLNKMDIVETSPVITQLETEKPIVNISAKNNEGIDLIYKELLEMFKINEINLDNENIITNVRHKNLIEEAVNSLEKAEETVDAGMPIDIIAINIKDVVEALNKITGESVSEDLLTEIFAKFCLGK